MKNIIMNAKQPALYIVANRRNWTIYVGVTSNLAQRIYQHKNNLVDGFTKRHNCKILVYYEYYETMIDAITRENQIKAKRREPKIDLITTMNFDWKDLSAQE